MNKITEYLNDVRAEMKKVSWPTQKELTDYTIVVLVFTVIMSLFIFGVDHFFSSALELLYR